MIRGTTFRRWALGLAMACAGWVAQAEPTCRMAFDVGSSGVRVGASNSAAEAHVDIDFLSPLWAGLGLGETRLPTAAALKNLPLDAGLSAQCERVAATFSAWRLAWQQAGGDTAALMARLQADTGVAVLVMPQSVEGAYAYASARQVLGTKLRTSHVLDIGGGSLQIAGANTSDGRALGQKSWHQLLCTSLRQSAVAACELQPMSAQDLQAARRLLDDKFSDLSRTLGPQPTLTAISRPVTRGVAPAVRLLAGETRTSAERLSALDISTAIIKMAELSTDQTAAWVATPAMYATYLLSDALLLEGLLRAIGAADIQVVEGHLSILPALLADDKAFQWSAHYGCYLERFKVSGPDAYSSDPATCLAQTGTLFGVQPQERDKRQQGDPPDHDKGR